MVKKKIPKNCTPGQNRVMAPAPFMEVMMEGFPQKIFREYVCNFNSISQTSVDELLALNSKSQQIISLGLPNVQDDTWASEEAETEPRRATLS